VRERADGLYHVGTYLAAKILEELLLALVASLVFASYVFYGGWQILSIGRASYPIMNWHTGCCLTHEVLGKTDLGSSIGRAKAMSMKTVALQRTCSLNADQSGCKSVWASAAQSVNKIQAPIVC
jgi:hypothetical protein